MDFFPYGVQYYRQPTPLPNEWEGDLKSIKEAGYTHIQLRPQWRWAEKIEGKYYFDDIETLMDLADKIGLRVVVKPFIDCGPDWIFSDYDGYMVGFNGVKFSPISFAAWYVGGWAPCFDNPPVLEKACEFVKELTRRVKDHPSLWFYDAWNEPACVDMCQCQCEHSKNNYRKWLKDKFKDIDTLNNMFGKAWTSFDLIEPPIGLQDYVEMMLWKTWSGWTVGDHVHSVYKAIKSVDPDRDVMCHAGPNQIFCDPVLETRDDMANAKAVDFYGTSFNVTMHPQNFEDIMKGYAIGDWIRCVSPKFWVHEVYPSEGEWGAEPKERDLRRMVWQAVMTGAEGLTYWQFKKERFGFESYGWGMRGPDGSKTRESEICDDIGSRIKKYEKLFADSKPPQALIGHIYHKEEHLISSLECQEFWRITDPDLKIDNTYQKALFNNHCLFTTRFKGTSDYLTWFSDFSKYKCITFAQDEIITKNWAEKLKEYVKAGGNLIIEYPFADREISTWVALKSPNYGLEELTGYKVIRRSKNKGYTASLEGVGKLTGTPWYFEGEIIGDAEVLGEWETGHPAFVKNKYGKGTVYSLIASPSLIYNDTNKKACINIANYILNDLNLGKVLPYGTLWKERVTDNKKIIYVINNSEVEVDYVENCEDIIDSDSAKYENGIMKVSIGGFVIYTKDL